MLRYYSVDELVNGSFLRRHEVVAVGVLGDLLEVLGMRGLMAAFMLAQGRQYIGSIG
jgi:hypothetical protein